MGFDSECNFSLPTILLRLLLFTCGYGVSFFGGIQHSPVDGCCPQDWKRSVFIPVSKKGNAKECSNYGTIALISHASKVMLKILKARLQQYVNHEIPDVQIGLGKAEEPEIKLPTTTESLKKQESSRKTSLSASLTMPKALTVWITINCGKF